MPRYVPQPVVWTVACAILAAPSATVSGQQPTPAQTPPIFRGGVDLIQVDVVVLDAEGRPVHGLTKNDFTLIDRGKPRAVATLAEQSNNHPPEPLLPAGLPLDVANNQTAASDRLVVIVLDDLHFRGRTEEARTLVHQVVERLGDGVTLSLVTTSRQFDVEPTEDRTRVLLAVDQFVDRFDPGRRGSTGGGEAGIAGRGPSNLADPFSTLSTYRFVGNVAKMIGADDGRRKAFVWISAGVPAAGLAPFVQKVPSGMRDPCDGAAEVQWSCEEIAGMLDKFRRSSVTVYGVNPGGPTDGGMSLDAITKLTGGFNVPPADLDRGMARLLGDLDNYYLLGFYPDVPIDRKYHQIDVRVNRPGLTVRYRTGYQPGGPPAPPKNDTVLGTLVGPVMPTTDLPLRLSAVPFFTSGSSVQLVTTLEFDLTGFPPAGADGRVTDRVDFGIFAVDLKKKKVTRDIAKKIEVAWPVESGHPSGTPPFRVQTVLTLPPGPYQLRASATAKAINKTGSVYLLLDIPPAADGPLGLSGLAISSRRARVLDARLVDVTPLAGLTLPFAPSLTRVFPPDDELRVFFQVHRHSASTPVMGTVSLVDDGGSPHAQVPWKLTSIRESSIDVRALLAGLPTGPYRLVVAASDGTHQATREAGVRIDSPREP